MKKRSSLLRTDVTRSLKDHAVNVEAAQRRLRRSAGVYNVQPWGYVLGVLGALLSVLFATYAAIQYGQRSSTKGAGDAVNQQPPSSPTENYVPIEVE